MHDCDEEANSPLGSVGLSKPSHDLVQYMGKPTTHRRSSHFAKEIQLCTLWAGPSADTISMVVALLSHCSLQGGHGGSCVTESFAAGHDASPTRFSQLQCNFERSSQCLWSVYDCSQLRADGRPAGHLSEATHKLVVGSSRIHSHKLATVPQCRCGLHQTFRHLGRWHTEHDCETVSKRPQ